MRKVISLLVIARLIQRLLNGSRRGPGMGSWNQDARPGSQRRGPDAVPPEPRQGEQPGSDQDTSSGEGAKTGDR